jgi:hypothetical protein
MSMVKEIQATLYDVFGFLVPGTVVVAAVALLFCFFYLPPAPTTYPAPDLLAWVAGIVLAYFGGHMAQALGNITEGIFTPIEKIVLEGPEGRYRLADQVIAACKVKLKETLKVDPDGMKAWSLYRQCDDAVLRSGKIGEREVYVYREGFYRGSAIAFALLAASALLIMARLYVSLMISLDPAYWHGWSIALWIVAPVALLAVGISFGASFYKWKKRLRWLAAACSTVCVAALLLLVPRLVFGQHAIEVDGWGDYREMFWFVFAIALCCSYLSFRRYRRFGMYRVTQAMHGFVSIKDDKKDDKKTRDAAAEPAA